MVNSIFYETCLPNTGLSKCLYSIGPIVATSTGNNVTFMIKLYPGTEPYLSKGTYIGLVTNHTPDDTIQFIFNAEISTFIITSPNINNHTLSLNSDFNPVLTCGSSNFKNNQFLMSIYQRLH